MGSGSTVLRSWVTWCVLVALAVRLPLLGAPVGSDEGGLLLVGGSWGSGDGSLYGSYWVDRPPLLIALHELAERTGGTVGLRVIGCVGAVATILTAWHVGRLVSGRDGGRWAAVMATAIVSAPTIAVPHVSSEMLAAPFVLGAAACTLRAVGEHTRRPWALAIAAGALAACAPLLKQSIIGGFLAIATIVVVAGIQRRVGRRRAVVLVVAALAGAVATVALVAAFTALRGTPLIDLWHALFAFRAEAGTVISQHATRATEDRFVTLAIAFVAGGPLAVILLAAWVLRRAPSPASVTTVVLLAWAVVSIIAGGSYWAHYLLQLTPGLSMAVAVAMSSDRFGRRAARGVTAYVAALALATGVTASASSTLTDRETVGEWLGTVVHQGDTAVVAWGAPSILHEAGVSSPYEQLWSLPVRVNDPELTEFVGVLRSTRAPNWVITRGPSVNSWGIDPGTADRVIRENYDAVADVCGYRIHLRKGETRSLPDARGGATVQCPGEGRPGG